MRWARVVGRPFRPTRLLPTDRGEIMIDQEKINRIKGVNNTKETPDTVVTAQGDEFTREELENSRRIYKSKTPKQDLSWYVKWISSVFILASMSIRGIDGLQQYDLMLSIVGVAGWMWVGFLWKDRALILLNGTGILLFISTLLREYIFVAS